MKFYKTHNVRTTLKKFGITYKQLKDICYECRYTKNSNDLKNTYKQTKIDKYGSLDEAYKIKAQKQKETIMDTYKSMELYYTIRDLNTQKVNRKKTGVPYPMMNKETVEKANKTKREGK